MTKSPVQLYLTNCKSFYSCIYCHTHLANHDELVSRSFQGINGRAYLFNSVINVICCPVVQRELNTGSHAVADILCVECETILGWKYERAYVETQKYKEGKYIIEMAHVVRENRHLELDKGKLFFGQQQQKSSSHSYGRSVVRRYYSSLTPGNMSCPTATGIASSNEEVDADEEELMFPFYDDLCAGQSSYTNSGLNRMRRSLYLDSTPYDWKHSATSSSSPSDRWPTGSSLATHNQLSSSVTKIASQQQVALASSLGSSDLSPSTSSSSSASTPPDVRTTTQNSLRTNSSNHPNDHSDTLCNLICNLDANAVSDANEEEETQFKFETEDPVIPSYSSKWESSVAAFNELYLKVSQRKLHLDESGSKEDAEYGIMLQKLRNIYATLERQHKADEPLHDIKVLRGMMRTIIRDNDNDNNNSTTTTSGENNTPSRDSSVSLDDEEFFDCCTDHEISNSATNCGSNTSSSSTVGTTRNNTTITNN